MRDRGSGRSAEYQGPCGWPHRVGKRLRGSVKNMTRGSGEAAAQKRSVVVTVYEHHVPYRRLFAKKQAKTCGKSLSGGAQHLNPAVRGVGTMDRLNIGQLQGGAHSLVLRRPYLHGPDESCRDAQDGDARKSSNKPPWSAGPGQRDPPGRQRQECNHRSLPLKRQHPQKRYDRKSSHSRTHEIGEVQPGDPPYLAGKGQRHRQSRTEKWKGVGQIRNHEQRDLSLIKKQKKGIKITRRGGHSDGKRNRRAGKNVQKRDQGGVAASQRPPKE